MDSEIFRTAMEQVKKDFSSEYVMSVVKQTIDANLDDGNPRGHRNLIIVMEELAELGKEVSKELRGKGDYYSILEELADVCLGCLYVKEICKITDDDLSRAVDVKVKRMEEILDIKGKYE